MVESLLSGTTLFVGLMVAPPPPPFKAYDAVNEYEEVSAYDELTSWMISCEDEIA